MTWLFLSILTALAASSQDAWAKKFFSHLSAYEMTAYPMIYSLPLFVIAIFFVPLPPLDSIFFWCFLASIPLNGASFILYMKAIKVSPLSLTVPYLAFTPGFMIFTGYLFLGEVPDAWGGLGIIIICMGGYVLNLNFEKWDFLAPLKAVLNETGSWLMLIVSFLFSFAVVIGKKGIQHSSPLFFSVSFFTALNLFMILFLLASSKIHIKTFKNTPLKGVISGCLFFAHILLHAFAISLTKAAYMVSVKRLSIIFGIIYGGALFREKNIIIRLSGALLMLVGAVIITFKGQ